MRNYPTAIYSKLSLKICRGRAIVELLNPCQPEVARLVLQIDPGG